MANFESFRWVISSSLNMLFQNSVIVVEIKLAWLQNKNELPSLIQGFIQNIESEFFS